MLDTSKTAPFSLYPNNVPPKSVPPLRALTGNAPPSHPQQLGLLPGAALGKASSGAGRISSRASETSRSRASLGMVVSDLPLPGAQWPPFKGLPGAPGTGGAALPYDGLLKGCPGAQAGCSGEPRNTFLHFMRSGNSCLSPSKCTKSAAQGQCSTPACPPLSCPCPVRGAGACPLAPACRGARALKGWVFFCMLQDQLDLILLPLFLWPAPTALKDCKDCLPELQKAWRHLL